MDVCVIERGGKGGRYRNKVIEEVQEFKYLSFILNRKGNYKEHVRELCRKKRD